ncbi:hypothetical protein POX41_24315, partial [Escherichia coli]
MDWLLDVFATWLYGLKVIAITLAVIMFISGLDDFFIDVVYWVRRIKRKLSVYRRYPRMSYRELYKPDAYSALFDHGLASKSDQRFASIRSTG